MSNKRKLITDMFKVAKRRAAVAGAAYGADVANTLYNYVGNRVAPVSRSVGTQTTSKTKSQYARIKGGLEHRPYKRFRSKKARPINSKPLKKRQRKFINKVRKAIAYTKCYGEYVYLGNKQLRQASLDTYSTYFTDKNGIDISVGDARAAADAYSICFAGKAMNYDYGLLTGNVDNKTTFSTQFMLLNMHFKSTSTHVVNVEVYECMPKANMPGNQGPDDLMSLNSDDYVNRWAANNTATESTFNYTSLGSKVRHFTTLLQYYRVKVHNVKLLPGASSTLTFKRKAQTFDQSQLNDPANNLSPYVKGASYFFFRVINDPTVSGIASGEPACYHWPSNNQGGVALRYTRVIRVVPNNISSGTSYQAEKPAVAIGNWVDAVGSQTDQQVVYQAPFKLAEVAQ